MRRAVDPDRTTVNEAIALDPESVGPLSRLGIDTCCGGSLTLRIAAERHGVDLGVLLEAIGAGSGADDADEVSAAEAGGAPADTTPADTAAATEDGCASEGGSCACGRPVEER